ncbi:hypothetical protein Pelo_5704 [Pelomyxa schiedti]|nr:hypothetical protein Pelo_5704 [Pelomyxa schiedti]
MSRDAPASTNTRTDVLESLLARKISASPRVFVPRPHRHRFYPADKVWFTQVALCILAEEKRALRRQTREQAQEAQGESGLGVGGGESVMPAGPFAEVSLYITLEILEQLARLLCRMGRHPPTPSRQELLQRQTSTVIDRVAIMTTKIRGRGVDEEEETNDEEWE